MIKNIAQTIMYAVAIALLAMTTNLTLVVVFLIIAAILAAFESSRYLSAFEVGVTCIALACAMKGWWIAAIVFLAMVIIENLSFAFAQLRQKLIQLDQKRTTTFNQGEG